MVIPSTEDIKDAENYFKDGLYMQSANIFVSSSTPFEEVFLKFVQLNNPSALKELLLAKLAVIPENNYSQIAIVVICLLEMLLQLKFETAEGSDECDLLDVEIRALIEDPKVKDCLVAMKSKIFDLIASHGGDEYLLYFAREIKDFDTVIDYLVKRKRTKEAIEVLKECPPSDIKQLLRKSGHHLLREDPKELVSILKKCDSNPFTILPSLLRNIKTNKDPRKMKYIIEYLEDYISRNKRRKDKFLTNLLLTLYADYDDRKLIRALNSPSASSFPFNFESIFILDSCRKKRMTEAFVRILEKMGLYEDAVKQALVDNNPQLAQEVAKNSSLDERLRKQLWLMIARTVVAGEKNVKEWLKFAQESADVSVADLLPLMPEVDSIDQIKDSLSRCLLEYTDALNALKEDMTETTVNVDDTKADTKAWKAEFKQIFSWTQCSICDDTLNIGPFCVFNCDHAFHLTCTQDQEECHLCGRPLLMSVDKSLPPSTFDTDWN